MTALLGGRPGADGVAAMMEDALRARVGCKPLAPPSMESFSDRHSRARFALQLREASDPCQIAAGKLLYRIDIWCCKDAGHLVL